MRIGKMAKREAGGRERTVEEWYRPVPRSIRGPTIGGLAVVAAVFGGFGAWAATAPLAAAVVVSGTFVATGQNKFVQHLEGGIIREILVSEGDRVAKGQVLMVLDETASRAAWRRLLLRSGRYEAQAARLRAASVGASAIDLGPVRVDEDDRAEMEKIRAAQQGVFDAGLVQLGAKLSIVERNVDSLLRRSEGSRAQRDAVVRQSELIREEMAAKKSLVDKGLYRRSDLFSIQRAAVEAEGSLGRIEAEIGDVASQIERLRGQQEQIGQEYRQKALEELQAVNGELDDMREQMLAAENVLGRTEVRAPAAGVLVRMFYHTAGGVVEGGKQIAEILPEGERLVIEASIKPSDIDSVRTGQKAAVRLDSFNRRTTPLLDGEVVYVSADAVADPRAAVPGASVYVARIVIDEEEMRKVASLRITPGMPAELFVETEARTFLEYLAKPVKDSMGRAFREK